MKGSLFFAIVAFAACVLLPANVRAETPCDFKGIAVGDKMSPDQIMKTLGIQKYKINPEQSFDELMGLAKKYGLFPAAEVRDWKTGPYCNEDSCRIPYGVTVGNDNIPVSVFFGINRSGIIDAIDVQFAQTFWDQIRPIWDQKYGNDWKIEHDEMPITDNETNKTTILKRIILTHVSNGLNRSTNDHCIISARNLDIVLQHHDPMGPYHSLFEIELVSKNF